ncbi:OmpA family protein [Salinibius halmophilus]|uniref:OmpA family protein n=1 Tax=Salinibius halmophilus TaxID=1853216 RepID=UPI000E66FA64|nr:OmpA family protein [Salinibius halmophilus]
MKKLIIAAAIMAASNAALATEQANACDFSNPGWWNQCIFIGAGYGVSQLQPEPVGDSTWRVNNPWSHGPVVRAGLQVLPQIFAEASFAYLGSAAVENTADDTKGKVHYYAPAIWGAYEFLPTESEWNLFAKAGLGVILNGLSEDVADTVKETPAQLALGLGANYQFLPNWMARADLDLYSLDARYFSVGAQYLFGSTPEVEVEPTPEPQPVTRIITKEVCEEFGSALDGVNFDNDSAELTAGARNRLLQSVRILTENPELSVEIGAHTDSIASDEYNNELSQSRANAVLRFFIANGIAPERLSAVGYGESQPIASNETEIGRAQNRRVELTVSPEAVCEQVQIEETVAP